MDELVEKFRNKILERVSQNHNWRKSNQIEEEITLIFKTLRDQNRLSELEVLLNHENNTVVSYAAQYYWLVDQNKSIQALKELSKREDIDDPFLINYTIDQLKNGEINFD